MMLLISMKLTSCLTIYNKKVRGVANKGGMGIGGVVDTYIYDYYLYNVVCDVV